MRLLLQLIFGITVADTALDARAVTLKSYPKEIARSGVTVVEYWAPWCGNCAAFKPEYKRAKRAVGKRVRFLELNVDRVDDVESSFGLRYGLPTLALFKNGQLVSKLPGGGTAQEVIDWINANR